MNAQTRHLLIALGTVALVVVLFVAGWLILRPPHLIIQGEVDAKQVQVSSKIGGRILTIDVKRGNPVQKGQLLTTIDSPEIRARLSQAQAAEKAARAQQHKAEKGARVEEIRSARELWLKAKAASVLAEKTYKRIAQLHADGVVPAQKLDEAVANKDAALRTEEAARAAYDMTHAGARIEDKTAAAALATQAAGGVSEVQAHLEDTRLASPIDGEVTDIIPEVGELVSPGYPIINLVDLSDIWVTFNLREDLLSDIRMGGIFTVTLPALGNRKADLKIMYISALGEFATWTSTKSSGDFDLKTFEVRAVPVKPVPGLRPGMSAVIDWYRVRNHRAERD